MDLDGVDAQCVTKNIAALSVGAGYKAAARRRH
jgi:hypothetical protein